MEHKIKVKKSEDLIAWYNQAIEAGDLAEFSSVKGFTVYKPYGYRIWEMIQAYLNERFSEIGVSNGYFPLLIPESILSKEKEHIGGFTPEVAWVTQGGEGKLDERLAVRPTSETIISDSYSRWIRSYRDLPILINQWNTVVRWETKETRLFLRGREVLWQEGHCVFETEKEARENALKVLNIYKEVLESLLAVPVFAGRKSDGEKFAGAVETYTIEVAIPNNFMIQSATSHYLGQNFSKPFEIKFLDRENKWQYVYQTSWGLSMRSIGAMVMIHGDNTGLVLPPLVSPIQVVIIPIFDGENDKELLKYVAEISEKLAASGIRAKVDDRSFYSPGWKFNEYELKGVPIRFEIGKKELDMKTIAYKIRVDGKRGVLNFSEMDKTKEMLENIQSEMFERAYSVLQDRIKKVSKKDEFVSELKNARHIVKAAWCGDVKCEEKIKNETGATSRLIPLEEEGLIDTKCVFCGMPAKYNAYFSQSY